MKIILPIIIIAAIAGITIYSQNNSQNPSLDDAMMEKDSEVMEKKSDTMMMESDQQIDEQDNNQDDVMMKDDEKMMETDDMTMERDGFMVMEAPGKYLGYGNTDIASLEGDIVLFFHAGWCPTCRAVDTDIMNKVDTIPDGLTIVKVDYDRSQELKSRYGVTTQHTFVQIDNQGNKIASWTGGNTLDSVVAKVQ